VDHDAGAAPDQAAGLARLFHTTDDWAVYCLDREGRVTTWGEGARRIKGYAAAEIIGQPHSVFYRPEDRAAGKPAAMLQTAAELGLDEDQGWRVRQDGSSFWADVAIVALRDDAGSLVGYAKITRDRTKLHDAEEQLRRFDLLALRDQISEDLRESVVRRIFAAGLGLESILSRVTDHVANARIREVIDGLDETAKEVRAAVIHLDSADAGDPPPT